MSLYVSNLAKSVEYLLFKNGARSSIHTYNNLCVSINQRLNN